MSCDGFTITSIFTCHCFLKDMFLSKEKIIQERFIAIEKIVLLYPNILGLLGNC